MTEVQQAYWLGRDPSLVLGGVSCHFYREYDVEDLDLARLQNALDRLIERHEMLRAVFDQRGQARILPPQQLPSFAIGQDYASLDDLREHCAHRVFDPGQWPLFDVQAVTHGRHTRLAISLDNLILDALSILRFYTELDAVYRDPGLTLAPLELSFRDYQLQSAVEAAERQAAQHFWQERLPELPPPPQLPLAVDPASLGRPRFERLQGQIDAQAWGRSWPRRNSMASPHRPYCSARLPKPSAAGVRAPTSASTSRCSIVGRCTPRSIRSWAISPP